MIISELRFVSVSTDESLSETIKIYENVFRLQAHFHTNQTHFHMIGCAR